VTTISDTGSSPPAKVAAGSTPLPGHPGFWCSDLDDDLARALIARTHNADDVTLREMTRDLARFASEERLAQWRPARDLVCLQDDAGSLLGFGWVVDKPLPERDDYFDPELVRECDPRLTCAIRTYGPARGRGLLTKHFAVYAGEVIFARREGRNDPIWFETKADNLAARALGRQLGFVEMSGEAGGTVVGIRFAR
jgi:hypothetical protein